MGGLFSVPKELSNANSSGKPLDTPSIANPFAACLPCWWSDCVLDLTPSRVTSESSEDSAHGSVLTPRGTESASSGSLKIISSSSSRRGKQLPTLKEVEGGSVPQYTAKEMKAATSNYKLVLGRGGFGTVYKGTMGDPRTGQPVEVAIKVIETSSSLGPEQFMAHLEFRAKQAKRAKVAAEESGDIRIQMTHKAGRYTDDMTYVDVANMAIFTNIPFRDVDAEE